MSFADMLKHEYFLFVARGLFRPWEVACNHAARALDRGPAANEHLRGALNELNQKRVTLQNELHTLGECHIDVCAACKGRCCHGHRERDAFIDRILQDPDTQDRQARRRMGESTTDQCANLTAEGCILPYENRPIQCAAYFCRAAAAKLPAKQRQIGLRCAWGLMKVQLAVVVLMLGKRQRG